MRQLTKVGRGLRERGRVPQLTICPTQGCTIPLDYRRHARPARANLQHRVVPVREVAAPNEEVDLQAEAVVHVRQHLTVALLHVRDAANIALEEVILGDVRGVVEEDLLELREPFGRDAVLGCWAAPGNPRCWASCGAEYHGRSPQATSGSYPRAGGATTGQRSARSILSAPLRHCLRCETARPGGRSRACRWRPA
eukprot:scaffold18103_cov90-Phaeocystis_antarctica.AAC.2